MRSVPIQDVRLPLKNSPSATFLVRPATLLDVHQMAVTHNYAFGDTLIKQFLAPKAQLFVGDQIRIHKQGICNRYVKPNSLSLVACLSSEPSVVVGYGQFSRMGTDKGARDYVASRGILIRAWLFVLSYFFWIAFSISNFVWKDRITSPANMAKFRIAIRLDYENYWDPEKFPSRRDRWATNSLVVDPKYQGKGVGRLLMKEIMALAQQERVPVGLTASPHGEILYRKLGFEKLGDYSLNVVDEVGGGTFMWWPEGVDRS